MKFSNLAVGALSTFVVLRNQAFAALLSAVPALELKVVGTYETHTFDESAAEIVTHDPCSQRLFVVNAFKKTIDVIGVEDAENPVLLGHIEVPSGFSPNSVVFIPEEEAIAVAAGNDNVDSDGFKVYNGKVFFFDVEEGEPLPAVPISEVEVGNLPDSLTLTKDGKYILVANEGELLDDNMDPEGSVSIIYVNDGVTLSKLKDATLGFESLNTNALKDKGVRIRPEATAATDLEPEYIAVDPKSEYAFVTLQENNAVLKIEIKEFAKLLDNMAAFAFKDEDVLPLGFQDHSQTYLDPSDEDGFDEGGSVSFRVADNIFGIRMPDGIASFEDKEGNVYFATANEGDGRDNDEARLDKIVLDPTAFPNDLAEFLQKDSNFGRLTISTVDGKQTSAGSGTTYNQIYAFGSRSFSIFDADGNLVFDSGSDFEYLTFGANPAFFNSDNDEATFDTRSDAKGPEPEAIAIGEIGDRIYAFILLERVGGVMVYDVTEPAKSFFVTYINNRDFTADQETSAAGDLGPEGIIFIDKDDSPTGNYMLAVANEVSGTTTLYDIIEGVCPAKAAKATKRERGLVEGGPERVDTNNKYPKRGESAKNVRKLKPVKCPKRRNI